MGEKAISKRYQAHSSAKFDSGSDPSPSTTPTAIASWCVYDWANSAFGTLITTFVFGPYFITSIAQNPTHGAVQWSQATGIAALVLAVMSPVLGAIADQGGGRKTWLFIMTASCAGLCALLYFAQPETDYVVLALALFVGAVVASELSLVFYNSMLPSLVRKERVPLVSGWGLSVGYLGGVASLATALFFFVGENAPLAWLDTGGAENIRAITLLAALWYLVFAIPLFLFTPQVEGKSDSALRAVSAGLRQLSDTIRSARQHANTVRFLVSFLFYANGISTLFALGGIYVVGEFGMSLEEVTQFAIVLNVAAGVGAAVFGWIDGWLGPKRTLFLALTGLICAGTILVLTDSKTSLWLIGSLLGGLIGGAQATSRSFMARVSPKEMAAQMFGLYAMSGKVTAFAGPLVFAAATSVFDSQRAGMVSIIGFFAIGLLLLWKVKDPPHNSEGGTA